MTAIEHVNYYKTSCEWCGKNQDVYAVGGEFVCYACLTKKENPEKDAVIRQLMEETPSDRVKLYYDYKGESLETLKMMLEIAKITQQLMQETPPDKVKPWQFYERKSLEALQIMLVKEQARKKRLETEEDRAARLHEALKRSEQASQTIKAMENILVLSLGRGTVSNKQKNAVIDIKIKKGYEGKDFKGIIEYFKHALSSSDYPSDFPRTFQIDYNPETSMLIVNYSLPNINVMPKIKEVKYVKSKNDLLEVPLAESTVNELYDSVVYQITLRTLHELFESDVYNMIEAIILNGWVESIDTAIGKNVNRCIISIQTNRQEFSQIDLARVDPKACFKKLKGIGSSALHSWTAIAPIVIINREDKRFVQGYEVAKDLEESFNLAGMPWEDFEHLVRELFDKEFSQDGGGVNITRTSRDGGIDAIAFDPDPIRGGKIAIQAKCYTNTVGVDAVRDLYGTVINEGANKGILVTTSDYGPEAYEFAKGKPLTLMNGSNLLYLLEKHGYKAKIDLKAAKEIKSTRESTK